PTIAAVSSAVRPLERLFAKTAKASAATAAAVIHEAPRDDIAPTVAAHSRRVNPSTGVRDRERNRGPRPSRRGPRSSGAEGRLRSNVPLRQELDLPLEGRGSRTREVSGAVDGAAKGRWDTEHAHDRFRRGWIAGRDGARGHAVLRDGARRAPTEGARAVLLARRAGLGSSARAARVHGAATAGVGGTLAVIRQTGSRPGSSAAAVGAGPRALGGGEDTGFRPGSSAAGVGAGPRALRNGASSTGSRPGSSAAG